MRALVLSESWAMGEAFPPGQTKRVLGRLRSVESNCAARNRPITWVAGNPGFSVATVIPTAESVAYNS